jgi:hypothetical protein
MGNSIIVIDWLKEVTGFGRTRVEKAALRLFQKQFPNEYIDWTFILERKNNETIIGIGYGVVKPPQYMFYSVGDDLKTRHLENYTPPKNF